MDNLKFYLLKRLKQKNKPFLF